MIERSDEIRTDELRVGDVVVSSDDDHVFFIVDVARDSRTLKTLGGRTLGLSVAYLHIDCFFEEERVVDDYWYDFFLESGTLIRRRRRTP